MITIDQIKELRELTGVSVIECKKALEEAGGDFEKAKEILRKKGQAMANKRADKETNAGIIECYIHPNKKVGVLLDINSETDFVSRSEDFRNLAHELCLQIAALNPSFIKEDDIPEELLAEERKIYLAQAGELGKPQNIIDQIVDGKLKKFKEGTTLLSQPWIKDESKSVKDLIDECVGKVGENIVIKRFVRYEI